MVVLWLCSLGVVLQGHVPLAQVCILHVLYITLIYQVLLPGPKDGGTQAGGQAQEDSGGSDRQDQINGLGSSPGQFGGGRDAIFSGYSHR